MILAAFLAAAPLSLPIDSVIQPPDAARGNSAVPQRRAAPDIERIEQIMRDEQVKTDARKAAEAAQLAALDRLQRATDRQLHELLDAPPPSPPPADGFSNWTPPPDDSSDARRPEQATDFPRPSPPSLLQPPPTWSIYPITIALFGGIWAWLSWRRRKNRPDK